MVSYLGVFGVHGSLRFLSHLELMKVFRQAFRRCGLPVGYSEGFNPHMKLSFAIAKGVGLESRGELLEIDLLEPIKPKEWMDRINQSLPTGLVIYEMMEKRPSGKAPMALLKRATYLLRGDESILEQGALKLLEPEMIMEVRSKKSLSMKNLQDFIVKVERVAEGIEITLLSGSERNLRIDYVLRYLELPLVAERRALWGESGLLSEMLSVPNETIEEELKG